MGAGPTYSIGGVDLTAHSSWSDEDLATFVETSEAMSLAAGDVLRAAGWQGTWDSGKRTYDGMNSAYMEFGTKAAFSHPQFTGGRRTTLFVRTTMVRDADKASAGAASFARYMEGIAQHSDQGTTYRLVENRPLGLGSDSRIFVVEQTKKTVVGKVRTEMQVAAYFVSGRWMVSVEDAADAVAVEAAMRALAQGLSAPRAPVGGGAGSAEDSAEAPDEAWIEDRLSESAEAEMTGFDQFFYRVEIPEDQALLLLEAPSAGALEVIRLLPGATDLRVRGLDRSEGLLWADLCAGAQCGWAVAHHLRRQAPIAPNRARYVEAAYPEVNVFLEPSVRSGYMGKVEAGQRFEPGVTATDENGDTWVRICGEGWCGWAGEEFFTHVD
ncbi:hypothetical protein [Rhodovulum euryhalinum]|uniref:hypothetical protein n=1 Tax=Rhodovulum euryhalinum TaxID=35805 RepID=UPI0010435F13|nr:hypothetical protein [Rhodovulum euryhalinum]